MNILTYNFLNGSFFFFMNQEISKILDDDAALDGQILESRDPKSLEPVKSGNFYGAAAPLPTRLTLRVAMASKSVEVAEKVKPSKKVRKIEYACNIMPCSNKAIACCGDKTFMCQQHLQEPYAMFQTNLPKEPRSKKSGKN